MKYICHSTLIKSCILSYKQSGSVLSVLLYFTLIYIYTYDLVSSLFCVMSTLSFSNIASWQHRVSRQYTRQCWHGMLPWDNVEVTHGVAMKWCCHKAMLLQDNAEMTHDVAMRWCCHETMLLQAMLMWHTMQCHHEMMLLRSDVDVTHDVAMKWCYHEANVTSCQHHLVSSVSCKHQLVIALSCANIFSWCQHFLVVSMSSSVNIMVYQMYDDFW